MKNTAYDRYVERLTGAWKDDEDSTDNDRPDIIPDGGMVRVSMLAMDSVQRGLSTSVPASDAQPSPGNQAVLDAMKKQGDRVAAWRDHFVSKRETITDSPRNDYIRRVSTAWQSGEVV